MPAYYSARIVTRIVTSKDSKIFGDAQGYFCKILKKKKNPALKKFQKEKDPKFPN